MQCEAVDTRVKRWQGVKSCLTKCAAVSLALFKTQIFSNPQIDFFEIKEEIDAIKSSSGKLHKWWMKFKSCSSKLIKVYQMERPTWLWEQGRGAQGRWRGWWRRWEAGRWSASCQPCSSTSSRARAATASAPRKATVPWISVPHAENVENMFDIYLRTR